MAAMTQALVDTWQKASNVAPENTRNHPLIIRIEGSAIITCEDYTLATGYFLSLGEALDYLQDQASYQEEHDWVTEWVYEHDQSYPTALMSESPSGTLITYYLLDNPEWWQKSAEWCRDNIREDDRLTPRDYRHIETGFYG